jgi:hypothetical protein
MIMMGEGMGCNPTMKVFGSYDMGAKGRRCIGVSRTGFSGFGDLTI